MLDNNIYKSALLIYEAYNLIKDNEILSDDIKIALLELTTYFVNLNIDNEVTDNIKQLDDEMEKLIEDLKNKGSIDNIDNNMKETIQKEWNNINSCNGCNNMFDINNITSEEVDKLIEELTLELGE